MVKSSRAALRRLSSRKLRWAPYPTPSYRWKASGKDVGSKKTSVTLAKKDWEDATCSVCMEYPHNAVLLLCSSHDKGCRPYMCGTSYHHSNCLDQFKKAYTKVASSHYDPTADNETLELTSLSVACEKSESMDLVCPLCRGKVKGWTVVNTAREYLNKKKRSCMQENCSFSGTYKELSKHVRSEHPSANPHEVDPELEEKWRMLEHERERQDVISTIRSTMPRSVVFGDYVIDMSNSDNNTDDEIGDGHRDVDFETRGISRSILYFFLRESARLMRLHSHRDSGEIGNRVDGHSPNSVATDVFNLDQDDDMDPLTQRNDMDNLRSERRHRRRRRTRGRSASGES